MKLFYCEFMLRVHNFFIEFFPTFPKQFLEMLQCLSLCSWNETFFCLCESWWRHLCQFSKSFLKKNCWHKQYYFLVSNFHNITRAATKICRSWHRYVHQNFRLVNLSHKTNKSNLNTIWSSSAYLHISHGRVDRRWIEINTIGMG